MKRLCLFLLALVVLLVCPACQPPEQTDGEPHPLTYHEIMSLPTPEPGMYAYYWSYLDVYDFLDFLVEQGETFACVEVECLDVRYYMEWNAEKKVLTSSHSEYELAIQKIGTAQAFSPRKKEVVHAKSMVCLDYEGSPDSEDEAVIEEYYAKREAFVKAFLLSSGGVEDPQTGEVILESGIYELIPMSDMPLRLVNPQEFAIPMGEGETYTVLLTYEPQAYGVEACEYVAYHSYPSSNDSMIFTNNFYNLTDRRSTYHWDNMYTVAYLAYRDRINDLGQTPQE